MEFSEILFATLVIMIWFIFIILIFIFALSVISFTIYKTYNSINTCLQKLKQASKLACFWAIFISILMLMLFCHGFIILIIFFFLILPILSSSNILRMRDIVKKIYNNCFSSNYENVKNLFKNLTLENVINENENEIGSKNIFLHYMIYVAFIVIVGYMINYMDANKIINTIKTSINFITNMNTNITINNNFTLLSNTNIQPQNQFNKKDSSKSICDEQNCTLLCCVTGKVAGNKDDNSLSEYHIFVAGVYALLLTFFAIIRLKNEAQKLKNEENQLDIVKQQLENSSRQFIQKMYHDAVNNLGHKDSRATRMGGVFTLINEFLLNSSDESENLNKKYYKEYTKTAFETLINHLVGTASKEYDQYFGKHFKFKKHYDDETKKDIIYTRDIINLKYNDDEKLYKVEGETQEILNNLFLIQKYELSTTSENKNIGNKNNEILKNVISKIITTNSTKDEWWYPNLKGIILEKAYLVGVDISNMFFQGANLKRANLTNAILNNTYLAGADLTNADLTGIDLTDAILRGVILCDTDISEIDFSGFDLNNIKINASTIVNKKFLSAKFEIIIFRAIQKQNSKFIEIKLRKNKNKLDLALSEELVRLNNVDLINQLYEFNSKYHEKHNSNIFSNDFLGHIVNRYSRKIKYEKFDFAITINKENKWVADFEEGIEFEYKKLKEILNKSNKPAQEYIENLGFICGDFIELYIEFHSIFIENELKINYLLTFTNVLPMTSFIEINVKSDDDINPPDNMRDELYKLLFKQIKLPDNINFSSKIEGWRYMLDPNK